jgi:succinyl-diaminopimelate desuccinylase
MSDALLELAKSLIDKPSVSPDDAGCQQIIAARLTQLGFTVQHLPFGKVDNLWAIHGNGEPVFVFAGHTDVVPPGPLNQWISPPFQATVRDDFLYGRGAADMKTAIAAMIVACENFLATHPQHPGSIAFLITSDEEDKAIDGTKKVVEHLIAQKQKINWCLVGEASSEKQLGDVIKNGRRGSLSGNLTIYGKQGHIAYPERTENPIQRALPALQELSATKWDQGNEYFPATQFQMSNIHGGTGATNVIPGELNVFFNFRYSSESTAAELQKKVEAVLNKHALNYSLTWEHSGEPFLTKEGLLTQTAQAVIQIVTGTKAILSTGGGTSDGRFIAAMQCEIIELGVCNTSIHQINEGIAVQDLLNLEKIYYALLCRLLLK